MAGFVWRGEEKLNLRSVETPLPSSKTQLEPGSGKEKCPECGQEKRCDSSSRPLPFFFFPFLFCFENPCKLKKEEVTEQGYETVVCFKYLP